MYVTFASLLLHVLDGETLRCLGRKTNESREKWTFGAFVNSHVIRSHPIVPKVCDLRTTVYRRLSPMLCCRSFATSS